MACSEDVLSPRLCAFTAVFINIDYGFSIEFLLLSNVFFYGLSMDYLWFVMDVLCILHGFSVELPCVVLQIHLILFQCLMILPSLLLVIPDLYNISHAFHSIDINTRFTLLFLSLFSLLLNSFPSHFSTRDILIVFTSSDDVLEQHTGTWKSYLNVEAISAPLQKACVDLHGHGAAWI